MEELVVGHQIVAKQISSFLCFSVAIMFRSHFNFHQFNFMHRATANTYIHTETLTQPKHADSGQHICSRLFLVKSQYSSQTYYLFLIAFYTLIFISLAPTHSHIRRGLGTLSFLFYFLPINRPRCTLSEINSQSDQPITTNSPTTETTSQNIQIVKCAVRAHSRHINHSMNGEKKSNKLLNSQWYTAP